MGTVNQAKKYLGNRSVYVGPDLPETNLEDGFIFYKTGVNAGLYIYKNSMWEIASISDINDLAGILGIAKGGTGAGNAAAALTNLGGVTLVQVQTEIQTVSKNSQGNKTISLSTPVGGNDGDIWYQYE